MGTGILATLMQLHSGAVPVFGAIAPALLVLGWVLLVGLGAGFARSVVREPDVWSSSVHDAAMLPLWGMVSMGLMAVGSATFTVVGAHLPALSPTAFGIDVALWCAGTVLGLATAVGFTVWLWTARPDHPVPTWALPMVPPMVSATSGGLLAEQLDPGGVRTLVLLVSSISFVAALALGGGVIVVAYLHAWRRTPIPVALSPSTWIPLGIVGQSTAAAQVLADQILAGPGAGGAFLVGAGRAGGGLAGAAHLYGVVALTAGTALGAFAVISMVRAFLARMAFNPGWWAMTFPLGTCALGSLFLGWEVASLITVVGLCGTWTLCAVASVRAVLGSRSI